MKKQFKIFSFVFALLLSCMIMVSFGVTASAVEYANPTLCLTEYTAMPDQMFSTTLYIAEDAQIGNFQVSLKYDTNLVSLIGAIEDEDAGGSVIVNDSTPGLIHINYSRTNNTSSARNVLNLTFFVEADIGVGSYDLLTIDENYEYLSSRYVGTSNVQLPLDCDFPKLSIHNAGDIDLNGTVNILDAADLRRHLAKIITLSEHQLNFADAYYDGEINIIDAAHIQRKIAKFDVTLGNRVNVSFYDMEGKLYATKSVLTGLDLIKLPLVPAVEGYATGRWSTSKDAYILPDFTNIQNEMSIYAYYGEKNSEAMTYYKRILTNNYYSGDLQTGLSGNLSLASDITYQGTKTAKVYWSSSNNATLSASNGTFSRPTYDSKLTLTATIVSYIDGLIEMTDSIDFVYDVSGVYQTPDKASVVTWLNTFFKDGINYNLKLPQKITNENLESTSPYELRLTWTTIGADGVERPISQIERTNTSQTIDLVATVTFNGLPLEDDGKVYFDDVSVTAINESEIRSCVVEQIAAHMGLTVTNNEEFWSDNTPYNTTIKWISKNPEIATVENNIVTISNEAVNGTSLPLTVQVTYTSDEGVKTFELSYTVSVVTENTMLVPGVNIDEALYNALKEVTETRGNLTTEALKDNRFVYLDLSQYPDITDLTGLSYCKNLRVLNISGLQISRGMNEICTLNYLEAFLAKGCGLDNLTDAGVPVLKNAINLKLLDLSYNNFTSLDSVFAEGVRYGKLSEIYLNNNNIQDISTLSKAPAMSVLVLSNNNLTTEQIAPIENFKYLIYLSLADNRIDDVSALKDLRYLTELRLQNNNISNPYNLRKLTKLQALYLGNNNISSNIEFLDYLTELRVLYLNDNRIDDISSLTSLTKLEAINVSGNKLDTLSVLEAYSSTLKEVYAENNEIASFSFVKNMTNLRVLMLSYNVAYKESSLTSYLAGLTLLETLTLSGKPIDNLSFLDGMDKLIRLDIANCKLPAYLIIESGILTNNNTGVKTLEISAYQDNIASILNRKSTLRFLDISDNNMAYYTDEMIAYMATEQGLTVPVSGFTFTSAVLPCAVEDLYELNKLVGFYANNINKTLDISALTILMTDLRFVAFEDCGISELSWLAKFRNLVYVDLANNPIRNVDLGANISERSKATLQYLYLDTTSSETTFADAYISFDGNVLKELSLAGINVAGVDKLPYMDSLEYLNLSNTGITDIQGSEPDFYDVESIVRYENLKTLDVSHLNANISCLTELDSLETLYAIAEPSEKLFFKTDILTLYTLYNNGVNCYLYDYDEKYTPNANAEGSEILGELPDISCNIIVAADNVISNNNPFIQSTVNDFDIVWTLSNSTNYEIVNNRLSVKDYTNINDEALTATATITIYPNQAPVSRSFTINTSILRADKKYYSYNETGFDDSMCRDESFTYDVRIKAAVTDGFSAAVKPVVGEIKYAYSSVLSNGSTNVPYTNILAESGSHQYKIKSDAPLGSRTTLTVNIGHYINGAFIIDDSVSRTVTVESRTFTVNYVVNGGKLVASNGSSITSQRKAEDATLFGDITISRTGYLFAGWYTDPACNNKFTATKMPAQNITLYAKWTPHSFTITFNANGGTVGTTFKTVLCDQAYGTLPTPTRDYHNFVGWYTAISGGTKVTSSTTSSEAQNITLYAIWELKPEKGWVKASELPTGAQVTSRKWSYTKTHYTTSGSSSMSGWTKYNTTSAWSDYGAWSAWQDGAVSASDSRQVETQQVIASTNYKTVYHYYYYSKAATGYGTSYYPTNTYGKNKYSVDLETELKKTGTTYKYNGYTMVQYKMWHTNNTKYRYVYACYANEAPYAYKTQEVASYNYKTQYRYRDRSLIYTYYFYRTENLEATSYPSGSNLSNIQEWVKYREK